MSGGTQRKEPSFTVGMEEEYLLVDRESRDLVVDPPDSLMSRCEKELGERVSPEFLQSQIEVGTSKCETVGQAVAELAQMRRTIARIAGEEKYYLQHWRSLHADFNTATAQALLAMQKPAERCNMIELAEVAEASSKSFASGDLASGIASLKTMLHWSSSEDLDQTTAEVPVPYAVHDHPRGQRMTRIGEPARELQAAAGPLADDHARHDDDAGAQPGVSSNGDRQPTASLLSHRYVTVVEVPHGGHDDGLVADRHVIVDRDPLRPGRTSPRGAGGLHAQGL